MSIYLGIDPASRLVGYCYYDSTADVLQKGGQIRLLGADAVERTITLQGILRTILADRRPDFVAVERMFRKGNRADTVLANVVFVCKQVLREFALPLVEVGPSEARSLVCDKGDAAKWEVQRYLEWTYGVKFDSLDASDAACIAIAAARRSILPAKPRRPSRASARRDFERLVMGR